MNRTYPQEWRRKIARFALYSQRAHLDPRTSQFISGNHTGRPGTAIAFLRLFPDAHGRLAYLCRPRLQLAAARHLRPDADRPAANADRAERHAPARISGISGEDLLAVWSWQFQSRPAGADSARPLHLPDRRRPRPPYGF